MRLQGWLRPEMMRPRRVRRCPHDAPGSGPARARLDGHGVAGAEQTARQSRAPRAPACSEVIQELKNSPNVHAQSLAGGRSRSIGVIVSNIENPFFLDVYKTVEAGAHAAGYEVIMANTDYSSERLVTSIRLMLGRRLAGVAAIVSEMDAALIQELSSQRIPVVFYDVGTPRRNITNIRVDYRGGMAKLNTYLYSLGHRRVGVHRPPRDAGPYPRARTVTPRRDRQIPRLWRWDMATDADTLEGGRQAARVLRPRSPRPTALVCVNDVMAVGALREAALPAGCACPRICRSQDSTT